MEMRTLFSKSDSVFGSALNENMHYTSVTVNLPLIAKLKYVICGVNMLVVEFQRNKFIK